MRENWVFVDIFNVCAEIGADVFWRIEGFTYYRQR